MTPAYERYAEALFKTAEKLGCADVVVNELSAMETLIKECRGYLNNPLISTTKKAALLQELLLDKVSPLMLEYILLMTTRRHLKYFYTSAEHFRKLSSRDKAVIELRVPFQPEQDVITHLMSRLVKEKLVPENAKETEFQIVEDKELIGGFVAYCDGYQIDTSFKTALNKLKRGSQAGSFAAPDTQPHLNHQERLIH